MLAVIILRLSSQLLHSIMGGIAVFCLYYAAALSDSDLVLDLVVEAFKFGGMAIIIAYLQGKYLNA